MKGPSRSSEQHRPWKLRECHCVACQEDVFRVEHPFLISTADVSREAKEPGTCGQLRKTMFQSFDIVQQWGEHCAQVLEAGGFVQGVASPRHFFHKGLQTSIMVNGDDFFTVGRREGRKHALRLLQGAYELSKVDSLGTVS